MTKHLIQCHKEPHTMVSKKLRVDRFQKNIGLLFQSFEIVSTRVFNAICKRKESSLLRMRYLAFLILRSYLPFCLKLVESKITSDYLIRDLKLCKSEQLEIILVQTNFSPKRRYNHPMQCTLSTTRVINQFGRKRYQKLREKHYLKSNKYLYNERCNKYLHKQRFCITLFLRLILFIGHISR